MPDRRRISKLLSLILRHRPDEFGLNMDEYGYIPLDEVVEAVQQRYDAVEEQDIRDLIETSRQRRFEIADDRIRALYGHSFYVEMDGEPMAVPDSLYLCVTASQSERMPEEGIKSEDRFYLHLSPTREVAESRAGTVDDPTLVEVRAAAAAEAGAQFWERGEVVLTRQGIAPEYVGEIVPLEAPPASSRDEDDDEGRRPRRRRRRDRDRDRGRGDGGGHGRGGGGRGRPGRDERPARTADTTISAPAVAPQPLETPKATSWGRKPKFGKGSGRR